MLATLYIFSLLKYFHGYQSTKIFFSKILLKPNENFPDYRYAAKYVYDFILSCVLATLYIYLFVVRHYSCGYFQVIIY